MPKRTRRQSLLRCKKLWECLRDEGYDDKRKAYVLLGLEQDDESACPACEYNSTHGNKESTYCRSGCIINWETKNGACINWGCTAATRFESNFIRWCRAKNNKTRKKYAGKIVELCDQALANLPPLKKT